VAQLGESKYIDELNIESQKDYSKNYVDLTEDQRNTILKRVIARLNYEKVDPSKNQNTIVKKNTEIRLKKFVKDFKEKNKRLPSRKEITRQANTDYNSVVKYLDEGKDYLTKAESTKLKDPPRPIQDLNPAQKKWYKANKNYLFINNTTGKYKKMPDDFMSLTNSERTSVRDKYKNRATTGLNSKKNIFENNKKTLEDFLQSEINKVKPGQNVVFNGQRKQFLEKNNLPIFDADETKKIFDKFGGRFVFSNQKLLEIPGIEKKIIELAKTKGPAEIIQTLTKEKLIPKQNIGKSLKDGASKFSYKAINLALNKLLKEKKISKILPMDPRQGPKDKLVKDFIKNNPTADMPHRIAATIARNENIEMSPNFVKNSIKRLGLEKEFVSRNAKIFPQIKALDKIIKKNSNLIRGGTMNPAEKLRFLTNEYAKATKQPLAEASSQMKSRIERLGTLYQGRGSDRFETKLYSSIKKPIGFDNKFAENFIQIAHRASGVLNNSSIARMMGLPVKDIKLIDNLGNIGSALGVPVAGDHTDIKALMKNYPNYKKNFLRIQLISNELNQYKNQNFDRPFLQLVAKSKGANPRVQAELLKDMKELQKKFELDTGIKVDNFGKVDGKFDLKTKTMIPRIDQIENPYNEITKQGMINLETTGAPGEQKIKYTNIVDRLLINAKNVADRIKIFNKFQGTNVINESKAVKGLSKIPGPIGKAFKAITLGGAGAVAISVAANAGETTQTEGQVALLEKEKPETVQYNKETGSFINPVTEDKTDQNALLQWGQENPLTAVAGTSVALSAQEVPRSYRMRRGVGDTGPLPGGKGRIRSAIGIGGALKPILTTLGTPAIGLGFETLYGKERLEQGDSFSDILTDPLGPAASLAFMEPLSRGAGVIRGAPGGIGNYFKNYTDLSNVGKAKPGLTSKVLRLGMSPRVIAGASRFLGLPGLALTGGLAAYDAYKNYQNEEGMIYNLFND